MNTFKNLKGIEFVLLVVLVVSCKSEPTKKYNASYEINLKSPTDTVNRLDSYGLKQGKWIPTTSNKLKDTVYYHNDTLVTK